MGPSLKQQRVVYDQIILIVWQTILYWASHFSLFLNLRVTQPCKGEKERGTSNIGKCCNNNKHNILPIIIPLMPITLTFSTASKSLNSSFADPHRLRH